MEPFIELPISRKRNHLIKPRHQHPLPILSKVKHLGRLGVDLLSELLRVEAIMQNRGMLPVEMIEREVSVNVDRRDRDLILGFDPAQHIRTQQDRVAKADRSLPELFHVCGSASLTRRRLLRPRPRARA